MRAMGLLLLCQERIQQANALAACCLQTRGALQRAPPAPQRITPQKDKHTWETPVLAIWVERVWRRAHAHIHPEQLGVHPRVCTLLGHANRQIALQHDAALPRIIRRR